MRRKRRGKETWYSKVKESLSGPTPPTLIAIGMFILTVGGYTQVEAVRSNQGWFLLFGLMFFLPGMVLTYVKKPSYKTLVKTYEQAQDVIKSVDDALSWALREASQEAGLLRKECRSSLYIKAGERFVRLARVSANPEYSRGNRVLFVDNHNSEKRTLIRETWETGALSRVRLPEDRKEWVAHQVTQLGITLRQAEALTMQSRSYGGFTVDKHDSQPLAVVILESTTSQGVTMSKIEEFKASFSGQAAVIRLVERISNVPEIVERLQT